MMSFVVHASVRPHLMLALNLSVNCDLECQLQDLRVTTTAADRSVRSTQMSF